MNKSIITGAILAACLSACGGGGGGGNNSAATPPAAVVNEAQGIYSGTDGSGDTIVGTVLDSGAYYFVWINGSQTSLGLIQGSSSASGGKFTSTDAKNFYIGQNTLLSDTVTANYAAKSNISGTIAPASGAGSGTSFTASYSALYEQAASTASLAGTYSGEAGSLRTAEPVTLTIDSSGNVSGRGVSGCTFSGTAKPHGSVNVFDTTITFGGSPCAYPGGSLSGILIQNNGDVIASSPLADRSDAFVLFARK